jgi:benzoyl-CoA 2,3-dioxygenase component B
MLTEEAHHMFVGETGVAVTEPGKMASWVAPPAKGINGLPGEFEYVRLGA